ncbi:hypothetical protein K8R62_00305 [bacterium]|nr:hypothetical protein [bacterium]
MSIKKHLGTITILVKDRKTHSVDVQKILTDNGSIIMSRLGVNVQRSCVENCTGMIAVAVEGTAKQINDLTKKIDALYGVVARNNIMTK